MVHCLISSFSQKWKIVSRRQFFLAKKILTLENWFSCPNRIGRKWSPFSSLMIVWQRFSSNSFVKLKQSCLGKFQELKSLNIYLNVIHVGPNHIWWQKDNGNINHKNFLAGLAGKMPIGLSKIDYINQMLTLIMITICSLHTISSYIQYLQLVFAQYSIYYMMIQLMIVKIVWILGMNCFYYL